MCIIDLRCPSVCISILAIQSRCQTCPTTLPRWQTTRTKKFVLALPNLPTTSSSSCPPDSPPPRLASRSQSASLPTPKSAPAVKTRNTCRGRQNNLLAAHRRTWYRTSYSSPWTSDSPTAFKILTPSSSTPHQHGQFQKRKKKRARKRVRSNTYTPACQYPSASRGTQESPCPYRHPATAPAWHLDDPAC